MLLEFCARNSLCVTNTFFCHKTWHKGTWMHPRSKTLHMIDFVITRQKDRYLVQDTRVYRSVDVWSDHFFVGSSMVIPASKFHRSSGLNSYGCRRFDVSWLSQPEVVKQYQQALMLYNINHIKAMKHLKHYGAFSPKLFLVLPPIIWVLVQNRLHLTGFMTTLIPSNHCYYAKNYYSVKFYLPEKLKFQSQLTSSPSIDQHEITQSTLYTRYKTGGGRIKLKN